MNLKEQRAELLEQARAVVERAKAEGRDLTPNEGRDVDGKLAVVEDLDKQIAAAAKSEDVMDQINAMWLDAQPGAGGKSGRLALTGAAAKATAGRLMSKMSQDRVAPGRKSLVASGSEVTDSPLTGPVAREGTLPTSILELLPTVTRSSPTWRYLRQTTRTNNAAIVAAGSSKPTSTYTVTEESNELAVFAHMSEAVDKYLLADNANLQRFLAAELSYGLGLAVEDEVLTGDGTSGHLTGMLNTTGVQTCAFDTDKLITLRAAVTKLETEGFAAAAFVIHPSDWQDIEATRNSGGGFDLGSAVDRAGRKAWGVQVATSTQLAAGTALALDTGAVAVSTDGVISLLWSDSVSDDFSKNQIRARCESRFALDVFQPEGIVKVTLSDTT